MNNLRKAAKYIFQNDTIGKYEKLILLALCTYSDRNNSTAISYKELSHKVHCSQRQTIAVVKALADMGCITVIRQKKPSINEYVITLDNMQKNNTSAITPTKLKTVTDAPTEPDTVGAEPAQEIAEVAETVNAASAQPVNADAEEIKPLSPFGIIVEQSGIEQMNIDEQNLFLETFDYMCNADYIKVRGVLHYNHEVNEHLMRINYDIVSRAAEIIRNKDGLSNGKVNYLASVLYGLLDNI